MATTSAPNPIINKEVLVKFGVKFSLGADILKLGNRQFEKELGSDQMSGDSVSFVVADGGDIQDNGSLDLTSALTGVNSNARRVKKRALTLEPIVAYKALTQEDLDLLINENEVGDKMTARALEAVQTKCFNVLKGAASAECADDASGIVDAFMGAEAYLEASKLDGELCGMANVWVDKAISSAYAKAGLGNHGIFKASQQGGLDAGAGFAGFKWAKATAGQNSRITGAYFTSTGAAGGTAATCTVLGGTVDADGSIVITTATIANSGFTSGQRIDSPFRIAGINIVDELGQDTGVPMSFTGVMGASNVVTLDKAIRFNVGAVDASGNPTSSVIDPLANASKNYDDDEISIAGGVVTIEYDSAKAITGVLTAGSSYYQPVLLWKKDELLVAVKGLKSMDGDHVTIPASFGGDKGIVPWRGTSWCDKKTSQHFARFDAYFGFGYFKGIGVRAIYIKAN